LQHQEVRGSKCHGLTEQQESPAPCSQPYEAVVMKAKNNKRIGCDCNTLLNALPLMRFRCCCRGRRRCACSAFSLVGLSPAAIDNAKPRDKSPSSSVHGNPSLAPKTPACSQISSRLDPSASSDFGDHVAVHQVCHMASRHLHNACEARPHHPTKDNP